MILAVKVGDASNVEELGGIEKLVTRGCEKVVGTLQVASHLQREALRRLSSTEERR